MDISTRRWGLVLVICMLGMVAVRAAYLVHAETPSRGTPEVCDGRGSCATSHALQRTLGRATPLPKPEVSELDAELARLYVACPASASIPIEEAAEYSVDSIEMKRLPAVHLAARQANAADGQNASGDWLIDPKDWYTEGDQAADEPAESNEAIENAETKSTEKTQPAPPIEPLQPAESDAQKDIFELQPPAEPETTRIEDLEMPIPPADEVTPAEPKSPPPAETVPAPAGAATGAVSAQVDPHRELFAKNCYPSARQCAACHKKQYDEWAASSHAYSAISPMFHKFEQKINDLSRGTIGYFCMRCHAPVATAMGESRATPLWEMAEVAREGVTCIACHRVQYHYGKVNGERRIETGDIFAPVFGGIGGVGVAEVIARKDHFKVKTSPHDKGPGLDIHGAGIYFDQINKSEFCAPCHQVAVQPGIKLEVVWEQYRASPACKEGISCQDCHMGTVPGVPSAYEITAIAEINGLTVNDQRKHANHVFYGPGYSIAHPGIFPWNLKANRWSMRDWLLFDHRAGWGTDEFEDAVADGSIQCEFPPVWAEVDDRFDAREIVEENLKKLDYKHDLRRQTLENGSHVDGPFFHSPPVAGQDMKFHYIITNTNPGHNLPSGSLGAQPQLWANVVLIAPDGRRIWESGYTDSFGDVADIHSYDVRHKLTPFDWQLFNLQTMFLITGVKGTDREFFLPINLDIDQLPFIRPGTIPITTTNHPPFIRMEGRSLAPLGSRRAKYRVPGELLCQKGTYRLAFRMRSRAEPIYFMRFVGATVEMQRAMNEWMVDVHPRSVEFDVR